MPMEIKLLVWSVALTLLQVAIAASGTVLTVGLVDGVGNRDNMPVFVGWVGRAHRAHRNMLESLLLFGVLVLIAQALGKFNAMTLLGAQLFFWGRVAYAVIYLAGIPWLRTLAWTVSIVGIVMVFLQVL
jgi:uncharacterized MAPEG superfamily protein